MSKWSGEQTTNLRDLLSISYWLVNWAPSSKDQTLVNLCAINSE